MSLSLCHDDSDTFESLPYYHGPIGRIAAEQLLQGDGQFLLRTSNSSNVQQLVLSCMHNGQLLHFIIHTTSTEPKRFFFEENAEFDNIQALIDHHRSNGRPIISSSPAIIVDPIHKSSTATDHPNHDHFPTEYLYKLYSKTSAIELEQVNDNDDASVLDENTVCQLILQHDSDVLAEHLFKSNLKFIGIDHDFHDQEWFISSGLELMLLPNGTQLRKDLIVRHECLKYFVIVTILNTLETGEHLEMIKKWIEIADQLENGFGDHYGFGSIMCGICFPKINLSNMWKEFDRFCSNEARIFENHLRLKFNNYLNATKCSSASSSIPFFIQLCHVIECSYIVDSVVLSPGHNRNLNESIRLKHEFDQKIGLNNFSFDDLIQLITMSNQVVDDLKNFATNSKLVQNGSTSNIATIDRLFQTNFQIKFLFKKTDPKMNYEDFHRLEQRLSENCGGFV